MKDAILKTCRLSHVYRKNGQPIEVLKDVNLHLFPGELVGIQGDSGSGKTTLLLACGAMLKPSAGEVWLSGDNLSEAGTSKRKQVRARQVGFLFQTLQLVPYLTVLENLLLHPAAHRAEAIEWLERFSLEDRIGHRPAELSHGQRQRVALIRALVHQPAVLIADEPTGNLDERNSRMVFEILRHFADSGGAVLIASHEPGLGERVDRVHRLEQGRLSSGPLVESPDGEVLQATDGITSAMEPVDRLEHDRTE